jgi:glucose-6-phosphate dehydrogenase assembly protein OpcA
MEKIVSTDLAELINPGMPVEPGTIDKALGRLWEETDDSKTRASLINLVIYTEDASSAQANTEIIAQLAGEHACRAILVVADPSAKKSSVRAWISAHCQTAGKGKRQICSEQITFQLCGDAASSLPSIVFSHLDSDLPLYFWWQGNFHERIDEEFWSWVDRLIFDSREWSHPGSMLEIVNRIGKLGADQPGDPRRTILCDLNWARLLNSRFAFAKFFDHPDALRQLPCLRHICVHHAPECRTTALLLLGWFAGQLGWKAQSLLGKPSFLRADGGEVSMELVECPGSSISSFEVCSDEAKIHFSREEGSGFYHVSMTGVNIPPTSQVLPAGKERIVDILLNELNRGGRHPLYKKAVDVIQPFF